MGTTDIPDPCSNPSSREVHASPPRMGKDAPGDPETTPSEDQWSALVNFRGVSSSLNRRPRSRYFRNSLAALYSLGFLLAWPRDESRNPSVHDLHYANSWADCVSIGTRLRRGFHPSEHFGALFRRRRVSLDRTFRLACGELHALEADFARTTFDLRENGQKPKGVAPCRADLHVKDLAGLGSEGQTNRECLSVPLKPRLYSHVCHTTLEMRRKKCYDGLQHYRPLPALLPI